MNSLREDATRLRDLGYSYNMIKEELGVSVSTQSNWFSNRVFTPNKEVIDRIKNGPIRNAELRHNERVIRTNKTLSEASIEVGELTKRDLWLLGLGIYMGEGSKSIESVRIINSDPDIIKISMKWFREICCLDDSNFALSLNLYPDNDEGEAISYWSKVTNMSPSSFKKTQIDVRKDKKRKHAGKLKYGTLQIRIRSNGDTAKGVVLFRRIKGWTKGAVNQV